MTSTAQTSAMQPPILKAVQTEDGITLYSLAADPSAPMHRPAEARVIVQRYPPDHPDYASAVDYLARTVLEQAETADGAKPG
jgi:hypothetical protein